jgi:hypothetical protein
MDFLLSYISTQFIEKAPVIYTPVLDPPDWNAPLAFGALARIAPAHTNTIWLRRFFGICGVVSQS